MTDAPILVTGAAGFIGSRVIERLRERGVPVHALVRDNAVAERFERVGCRVFRGDVTVPDSLTPAVADCAVVIHCARGSDEPTDARRVNVQGTVNVVTTAAAAGTRRLVHLSTVVAHGRRWPGVLTEDCPLQFRGDAYAATKAESERAALANAAPRGVEVVVVRPTIVYGPGSGRIVTDLARVNLERIKLIDHGRGLLNLVYVDDLVDGLVLAASRAAANEAFLLSGRAPVTCRDYLGHLARMCGKPLPARTSLWRGRLEATWDKWHFRFTRLPKRVEDEDLALMTQRSIVSIAKAERLLGFEPRVDLDEGMRRTEIWLRRVGYVAGRLVDRRAA
jgi:nucleoside-diphosphate-sugar epimerase